MSYKDLTIKIKQHPTKVRLIKMFLIDNKEHCTLDSQVYKTPTNINTEAAYKRWLRRVIQQFQYECEGVNLKQPDVFVAVIGTNKNFRQYANRIKKKVAAAVTHNWDNFTVLSKDWQVVQFVLCRRNDPVALRMFSWSKILCLKHAVNVNHWHEIHAELQQIIKEVKHYGHPLPVREKDASPNNR